jgi:hypothetical protein
VKLAWLGLGVLGIVLLVPFKAPLTLLLGVLLLLAFVAVGVFLIASPGFLAADQDDEPQ